MSIVVLCLGIGLVSYRLALHLYRDWPFLKRPRLSVLGTIAGHRQIGGEAGQVTLLVIRFESDDGQTVEVTEPYGPWAHELAVGSMIGIEYPAGFPQKARILGSYSPLQAYGTFVAFAILVGYLVYSTWST
jgi:hypothetical protein